MKKFKSIFTGIAALMLLMGILTACPTGSDDNGGNNAAITSVTISPKTPSVVKGGTLEFAATVAVTGNAAKTVTWSIEESAKKAGTTISAAGLLTVAADETLTSLTVKAASTADPSKSDTATVTISVGSVTSVTISPKTASVAKGDTQEFTAAVAVTEGAAQTVTWTIEESAKKAGTTISDTGLLTVAADETLTSLTVKAASTVDTSKSDTAAVTVVPAGPALTGSVSISGQAEVGATLGANTTQFVGEGAITYQWKRGDSAEAAGTDIEGATSATYTLVDADLDKYITVTVKRAGYSGSLTSSATAQVTEWILTPEIIAQYSTNSNGLALYIKSKTMGGTQEAPATIKFSGNISSSDLSYVCSAVNTAKTYVIWDLSKASRLTAGDIGSNINGGYIKGLVLPESLISIGSYAFRDCSSLTSITLPASLTTISGSAFYDCTILQTVEFEGNKVDFSNSSFPYSGTSLWTAYKTGAASGNKGVADTYTRDAPGNDAGKWSRQASS